MVTILETLFDEARAVAARNHHPSDMIQKK
jgi:hypothetical protein